MTTSQSFDFQLDWKGKTPDEASADLDTFLKLANTETYRIVKQTETEVVRVARRYVPVRTGKLRDSISGKVRVEGRDGIVLLVGSPVEYAYFVEFGTGKMAAQPYLRPALEEVGPTFKGGLKTAIAKAASQV